MVGPDAPYPVAMSSAQRHVLPRRSDLRGGVVALVVLSLLLVGVAFVMRPLDAIPNVTGASFLGGDGHLEVSGSGDVRIIRQTAHNTGGEMLGSGPSGLAFIDGAIDKLGAPFVRILETRVDSDRTVGSVHAFEVTPRGVLRAATLDEAVTVFLPPPIELPADLAEGAAWSDAGEIMRIPALGLPSRREFTRHSSAVAPEDPALRDEGCLVVRHRLATDQGSVDSEGVWCPGRGLVEGAPSQLGGADAQLRLEDRFDWSPQAWEATPLDLLSDPPLFWGNNIPAASSDDVFVTAHSTSGDVIFAPGYDVKAALRAHPGGHVTTLVRLGELVVATTTRGRVVGYDMGAVPLWDVVMPDVVTSQPVLFGDRLVVVDSAGNLSAIDPRSGQVLWEHSLRRQVTAAMATCHDLVVVPTNSEELTAFDRDGSQQWTTSFAEDVTHVACGPSGFVVNAGDRMETLSLAGVRLHSVVIHDSTLHHVFVTDDVVTVSATAVTRYRAGDLDMVARHHEELGSALQAGDHIVGVSDQRVVVWDSAGGEVGQWPTTIAPGHMNSYLTALDSGVLLIGPDLSALVLR